MAIRPISKELQAKAIEKLHEDPKTVLEDIKIVTDWLQKQPHLRARNDPQFILSYLRGCRFSIEKVKKKLENLYTSKTLLKDLFVRDPFSPGIQKLLQQGIILPCLKVESGDAPRVVITKHANILQHKLLDMAQYIIMMIDILLNEDDHAIIAGVVLINDLADMTLAELSHIDLVNTKRIFTAISNAYPDRSEHSHCINIQPFFDITMNMFKAIVPHKSLEKVTIHKNISSNEMHKIVSKNVLPNEYGGDAGPLQDLVDHWKQKVESYSSWFEEDTKYKLDESKRMGRKRSKGDLFGLDGSFRRLSLD